MAEITASNIDAVLRSQLDAISTSVESREVGTVAEVGDGIARVEGLRGAMAGELLEFETSDGSSVMGMALNLDEREVGAVLLGDFIKVKENDTVKTTGRIVRVPAGKGFLGRIVGPLGNPLDGKGPITADGYRNVEHKAIGVVERQPVTEPLQTGIMAIDAMVPIGRGQRELIIGDRQTGKTAIAIDTIINQKGTGVICVYVAIGQKASTVAAVVETLQQYGAMDYTIIVSATAADSAPLQYLAPMSGAAIAEYFMYTGADGQPREQGQPRKRDPAGLRRPLQAGRRLPPDVAHAPPPAGPRSVPGRRVLPAQPFARARGQDERRARWRFDDGAAGHRDAGGRRVGLHPDQRHLDHRRPDLPDLGPVLQGRSPSYQRRHLGVAQSAATRRSRP